MNQNSLSKNLYRLVIFVAIIPLLLAAYILFESRDSLTVSRLIFPVTAYVLFVCCLGILVNIFKKQYMNLTAQMEKFRQESQRRVAELNALRDISGLLKDAIPDNDLLKMILEKTMKLISVRNGSVFLVDPAAPEGLRLIASEPEVIIKYDDNNRPRRFSFVKSVIESGKALCIQDIEHDPRTMKSNDPKYGSPSFLSIPVYKSNQVIAVMNFANKESGGIFTESDERILMIILGAIGLGLENSCLRSTIKHQKAEITALNESLKKQMK